LKLLASQNRRGAEGDAPYALLQVYLTWGRQSYSIYAEGATPFFFAFFLAIS